MEGSNGHKRALGSLEVREIICPDSSWIIVAVVEVKIAVHQLLQKSAVTMSDLLSSLSGKT